MMRAPASLYRYTPGARGSALTLSRSSISAGVYNLIMSRWILALVLALVLSAQAQVLKKRGEAPRPVTKDGLPPEEDTSVAVKEYAFNPLQAQKEIAVGNQYFKKGSFRAAAGRFTE